MLSQAQEWAFNMESCRACDEKLMCHTATGIEKQTEGKTESASQTILWHSQKHSTHIKRENKKQQTFLI
jgi:hypothetical protein